MNNSKTYIGDKGIVNKTDSFGIVVIALCSVISVALVALGFLAFTA